MDNVHSPNQEDPQPNDNLPVIKNSVFIFISILIGVLLALWFAL